MLKWVSDIQLISVVLRILSCFNLLIYENNFLQELEPLPELKIFDEIRKFHEELCHTYSIRDHLLKVNKYHFPFNFYGCRTSSFKIIFSCFWYIVIFSLWRSLATFHQGCFYQGDFLCSTIFPILLSSIVFYDDGPKLFPLS